MKKKVDSRIQILIENIIKLNQRGMFVIIGDRGRDQVVNLNYLLQKHSSHKPKVLWCYKKELGFSSHKKKRAKEIKKLQKKGLYNQNVDDPFEVFIASTEIRYCYYKESHKVLGNTFNLLVLQDFESITPNILCRTVETIQGGGLIILLVQKMNTLKQFYTMCMDIHSRYRTDQFDSIEPRFNERFIMSLSKCHNALIMDDELNILPISSTIQDIVHKQRDTSYQQLQQFITSMEQQYQNNVNNQIFIEVLRMAKTQDQAKTIMQYFDILSTKNQRQTVSLTAGRGRGKSATLGITIALAILCNFSNIFVTAPSPENLQTLFEFIQKGLETLGYKENMDYEMIQSSNQEHNNAIVRVNVFKSHNQYIQYILPTDSMKIGQIDLLVIDEAAAIPLVYVKQLLGPYLIFLSSTINGYEGTGRSLSLKLLNKLREQNKFNSQLANDRVLKEIELNEPIRYGLDDPIEKWLYDLLLLNANNVNKLTDGLPHPNNCHLYLVNKDTLFSLKPTSEQFLFNVMSLFISSHYKNSPNDLQLLSDAPGHQVFVLLGPLTSGKVPDVLCAIQVCFEGQLQSQSMKNQNRGVKPAGDMIPWTIGEQFQDDNFGKLSGIRVVRIATHPHCIKSGYGSRALQQLTDFFEGNLVSTDDIERQPFFMASVYEQNESNQTIDSEKPKKKLKPLLRKLNEISPPQLDWIGTSYGLTKELFLFWKKNKFQPLYLRQTRNDLTAEHTCIMIKRITQNTTQELNSNWCDSLNQDFTKRFIKLLSYQFRQIDLSLALNVMNPYLTTNNEDDQNRESIIKKEILEKIINLNDLKRIEAYKSNMVDYYLILDLLPVLSELYFMKQLSCSTKLSYSQAAILTGIGLQHKSVDQISEELSLPVNQVLALFNKTVRKIYNSLNEIYETQYSKEMDTKLDLQQSKVENLKPLANDYDQQLQQEGNKVISNLTNKREHLYELNIDEKQISQYSNKDKLLEHQNLIIPRQKDKYDLNTGMKDSKKKKIKK